MRAAQINILLRLAYARGFASSGQGWNAEYPFECKGTEFTCDADWIDRREDDLSDLFRKERGKP